MSVNYRLSIINDTLPSNAIIVDNLFLNYNGQKTVILMGSFVKKKKIVNMHATNSSLT